MASLEEIRASNATLLAKTKENNKLIALRNYVDWLFDKWYEEVCPETKALKLQAACAGSREYERVLKEG